MFVNKKLSFVKFAKFLNLLSLWSDLKSFENFKIFADEKTSNSTFPICIHLL